MLAAFDSDACFAALLSSPENGRWLIAPKQGIERTSRRYRGDTLILETRFECNSGTMRLIDFMPLRDHPASDLMRVVIGERGSVPMRLELILRFGYGRATPWVTRIDKGVWSAVAGPDMVVLHTDVPVHGENMKSVAEFAVQAGQQVSAPKKQCIRAWRESLDFYSRRLNESAVRARCAAERRSHETSRSPPEAHLCAFQYGPNCLARPPSCT